MSIQINGFTPDDKVPGVVAKNEYGAGPMSIGAIALACVLFGNASSSGTADINTRQAITTREEADTYFGARSELGRMAHAALDIPGVTLFGVPVEEASGAAQAKCIIDIIGSWATSGQLGIQIDEQPISVGVAASHTATTFGDALADAVEGAQDGRLPCTAANVSGRVTLTIESAGVRGNQHTVFLDGSKLPSGMTVRFYQHSAVTKSGAGPAIAITSGAPSVTTTYVLTVSLGGANGTATFGITGNASSIVSGIVIPTTPFTYTIPGTDILLTFANGTYLLNETYTWVSTAKLVNTGMPFTGGTGTDDLDDAIDGTESVTNDYIALAHNDATNVGLMESACNAKAAFDVGRLEQYEVSTNGTLAEAVALGQAGMNDQLGSINWVQYGVEHPSRIAARVAALRSTVEGDRPNTNYDDVVIPGAGKQFRQADVPNRATKKSALNNSVTPLITTPSGDLVFVRKICSRSLNGSTPDYRTYDVADVSVTIRMNKELVALGTQLKAENPYAGPDKGDSMPPQGTLTPRLWNSKANALLLDKAKEGVDWVTDVEENPPQSEWQTDAKRIMSIVTFVVKPQDHQIGIIARQKAA